MQDPPDRQADHQEGTVWVEPTVEADIEYRDITSDRMLRHASFKGLK